MVLKTTERTQMLICSGMIAIALLAIFAWIVKLFICPSMDFDDDRSPTASWNVSNSTLETVNMLQYDDAAQSRTKVQRRRKRAGQKDSKCQCANPYQVPIFNNGCVKGIYVDCVENTKCVQSCKNLRTGEFLLPTDCTLAISCMDVCQYDRKTNSRNDVEMYREYFSKNCNSK